ncbi:apolipoprotein D-like [Mytilus californianus]|uniref:apolipoprotein D-like n=1 Tax=Mytilus californianus TaxID=6549 RepID=UPI002246118D|nr:apolipoprotein D-like [Mytilus californianus]
MLDFNFISKILFLLSLLVPIFGQVTRPGVCPNVRTQPGFDLNRQPKTTTVLHVTGYEQRMKNGEGTGQVRSIDGTAISTSALEPGRLVVQFTPFTPPGQYWVLDTDYVNYSVVYSCRQQGLQKIGKYSLEIQNNLRLQTSSIS